MNQPHGVKYWTARNLHSFRPLDHFGDGTPSSLDQIESRRSAERTRYNETEKGVTEEQ